MRPDNRVRLWRTLPWVAIPAMLVFLVITSLTKSQDKEKGHVPSTYDQVSPVLQGQGTFQAMMAKDKADKPAVMARQMKLLEERYNLAPRVDNKVTMTRGKPIPVGPATK